MTTDTDAKKTQKLDFSTINKTSTKSFNEQKSLIKKLFAGKTVPCQACRQPLQLVVPAKSQDEQEYGVFCRKGCTDIRLEFEM